MVKKSKKQIKREEKNFNGTCQYIVATIHKTKNELVFYETHPWKLILKTGLPTECLGKLPNGNFITASHCSQNKKSGTCTIWNFETLEIEKQIVLMKVYTIYQMVAINENEILIHVDYDKDENYIYLFSIEENAIMKIIETYDVFPFPIYLIDSNTFSTPSGSFNEISFWNLEEKSSKVMITTPGTEIESYGLMKRGERIVTQTGDMVKIWDSYTGDEISSFPYVNYNYTGFKPFGKKFLIANERDALRIYNHVNGKIMKEIKLKESYTFQVMDDKSKIFFDDENKLKMFDMLLDKITFEITFENGEKILSFSVLENINFTIFKRKLHVKENIFDSDKLFDTFFIFE